MGNFLRKLYSKQFLNYSTQSVRMPAYKKINHPVLEHAVIMWDALMKCTANQLKKPTSLFQLIHGHLNTYSSVHLW